MRGIPISVITTMVVALFAHAQFVKDGSIGQPTAPPPQAAAKSDTPSSWIQPGVKVLILPASKADQEFPVRYIYRDTSKKDRPPCSEVSGKVVVIETVMSYWVTLRDESSGKLYYAPRKNDRYAPTRDDLLENITPLSDLQAARDALLGKEVWCKTGALSTYDATTGIVGSTYIDVSRPVKISDVLAGWDDAKPVRVVVRTNAGKEGFIDIHYSNTNIFSYMQTTNNFSDYFSGSSRNSVNRPFEGSSCWKDHRFQ
jgi:hypothetical protein